MMHRMHRAFTLIELLVVIGIIAILASIGISVGLGVIQGSRSSATKNTIQVLETVLADLDAGGYEPREYRSFVTAGTGPGSEYELPVVDARLDSQGYDAELDKPIASLGRFLGVAQQLIGDLDDRWGGLDSEIIRQGEIGGAGDPVRGVELIDQWGNPIRAVHPAFDGGFGEYWSPTSSNMVSNRPLLQGKFKNGRGEQTFKFRRSYRPFNADTAKGNESGDADEGICPQGRLYFYSAGPDGDPGTRDDNVYGSVQPQWPTETAGFE
ncbi:MAG TPA: prepilin-type N-terminal cleavage/methylation domain-containing protein [Phycisphaerales bacterium]|nr:prepilin-type N-terminal cleavage/methylation domain-containing protein [Phycisphaerales bacterium]